jgi:DNA-binding SARP family transcriptional activator
MIRPVAIEPLSTGYGPGPMLEFRILGPLEVLTEHGPIPLGGLKQRATLAILLLHRNHVVSVDRLADGLYGGAPPVTAVTQVQRQISDLRKALGAAAATIETRPPGYVLRIEPEQLDLHRFEALAEDARSALAGGEAATAADLLREGLRLWRGPALADLGYEPFAQVPIERLGEIRLAAVEERIDAELALGRHAHLIGELEQLTAEHPLRERFRAQLMLALYRSGRQEEALDVYRTTRARLVDELGLEPGAALRELERAILAQDPVLELGRPGSVASAEARSTLVLPRQDERLDDLLRIAEVLARRPGRELIVARLLSDASAVRPAATALSARCALLEAPARSTAFTSSELATDVLRLATNYDVDLVLLDAPSDFAGERVPDELGAILERSPADVAVLAGGPVELTRGAGVFVPFGGGDHDWAALELGASVAVTADLPLRIVGTEAEPARGRRDASRLLADASLALQRVLPVQAEPVLAHATTEALVAAIEPATLVVAGISPRWRRQGIGVSRRALVRRAAVPGLFAHRGPRPSALAPRQSRTRFSWSVES